MPEGIYKRKSWMRTGKYLRIEETKRKISENKERAKKISLALIGKSKSEEHRKKLSLSKKGKSWGNHTIKSKEKIRKSKLGKKRPPFSKKWKKNMSLSKQGKNNFMFGKHHTEETKKKIGKNKISIRKLWQNEEYKKNQLSAQRKGLVKPNKPERFLIGLIKKNNLPFNYVGDGKIWFRGKNHSFNPDFLSKNPKHIIELFGDYWHNLPRVRRIDKERIETYVKYGYKTLVIWEHELKKISEQEIVNKIKEFII